jgi:hypothetical protein
LESLDVFFRNSFLFEGVEQLLGIGLEVSQEIFLLNLRCRISVVVDNAVNKDLIIVGLVSNFLRVNLKNLSIEFLFDSFRVIKQFSIRDLALVNLNHVL